MRKYLILLLMFLPVVFISSCVSSGKGIFLQTISLNGQKNDSVIKEKEKFKIDETASFEFSFSQKPKIGTAILKISFWDGAKKTTPYQLKGAYFMPVMKGAHDSDILDFAVNKKGDYLLPVDLVMPGAWEINVKIFKEKKLIYEGNIAIRI